MNFSLYKLKQDAFGLVELVIAVALMALISLLLFARQAGAQSTPQVYQPNFYKTYSFTTANTNQTLTPSFSDTIRQNSGESVYANIVGTNTTTANVTIKLDLTLDGSHWTSNGVFQWTIALNG